MPDFDALYRGDPDPWEVATSWYERRKIALVLAGLRRERYALAWVPASGTGQLAAALTDRCDRVVATDASTEAVRLTEATIAAYARTAPPVSVGHARGTASVAVSALPHVPGEARGADLVIVSEVLYYLAPEARAAAVEAVRAACAPDADVVAVHWRFEPEDGLVDGAAAQREVNDALGAHGWGRVVTHTDEEFLIGCWSRRMPTSFGR